jgi:hypothetical protein
MAVTVLGFDGGPFDQRSILASGDRFIRTLVRLKLTGNYTTGGDTLDFTNGGGTPAAPTTVPPAQQASSLGPIRTVVSDGPSIAGTVMANGGEYVVIPGTNPTNWLLKIFATAGAQYANGAYGADALTDTPIVELWWAR